MSHHDVINKTMTCNKPTWHEQNHHDMKWTLMTWIKPPWHARNPHGMNKTTMTCHKATWHEQNHQGMKWTLMTWTKPPWHVIKPHGMNKTTVTWNQTWNELPWHGQDIRTRITTITWSSHAARHHHHHQQSGLGSTCHAAGLDPQARSQWTWQEKQTQCIASISESKWNQPSLLVSPRNRPDVGTAARAVSFSWAFLLGVSNSPAACVSISSAAGTSFSWPPSSGSGSSPSWLSGGTSWTSSGRVSGRSGSMSDSQPPSPTVRIESIAAAGLFTFEAARLGFLGGAGISSAISANTSLASPTVKPVTSANSFGEGAFPCSPCHSWTISRNKLPNSAGAAMEQKRQIGSICKSSKPKLAKHLEPTSLQKSIICSRGVPGGSRGVPGVFPGCSRVVFFQGFHALHVPAKVC